MAVADTTVAITAGAGTPIRVLSGLGAGPGDQQVVSTAGYDGFITQNVSTAATATAAANTLVTLTLSAAGAGLFHYITSVTIQRFCTAVQTASATGPVSGGSNHPLVFSLPADAGTLGSLLTVAQLVPGTPIKTTTANTATTFTAPAQTGAIYRITVTYYIAP